MQFWSEIILDFKSISYCALIWFWNQAFDFRPNCAPPSSITIIHLDCNRMILSRQSKKNFYTDNCGLISLTTLPGMLSPKKQLFIFKEIVKEKIDLKIEEIIELDNSWQCFTKLLLLSWGTEMWRQQQIVKRLMFGVLALHSEKGLMLETSAFLPFMVANLHFQLSC